VYNLFKSETLKQYKAIHTSSYKLVLGFLSRQCSIFKGNINHKPIEMGFMKYETSVCYRSSGWGGHCLFKMRLKVVITNTEEF